VCKEFKVTGPEPPMESLVIILYAKESIRLMKFKQNSYSNEKRAPYISAQCKKELYERETPTE